MNDIMASTAERLSPELVLVSPGLRERAVLELATTPRPWELTPRRIVPLGWGEPDPAPFHILGMARMAVVVTGAVTALTLALTLIADAIR